MGTGGRGLMGTPHSPLRSLGGASSITTRLSESHHTIYKDTESRHDIHVEQRVERDPLISRLGPVSNAELPPAFTQLVRCLSLCVLSLDYGIIPHFRSLFG
jgi:hypothetical protein